MCPLLTCQMIFFLLPNSLLGRNSIFEMLIWRKKLKGKKFQDLQQKRYGTEKIIQDIKGLLVYMHF